MLDRIETWLDRPPSQPPFPQCMVEHCSSSSTSSSECVDHAGKQKDPRTSQSYVMLSLALGSLSHVPHSVSHRLGFFQLCIGCYRQKGKWRNQRLLRSWRSKKKEKEEKGNALQAHVSMKEGWEKAFFTLSHKYTYYTVYLALYRVPIAPKDTAAV